MVNSTSKSTNPVLKFFQWLWFEYTIITALYMLGIREKIAFTVCLIIVSTVVTYSTYIFLPHYLWTLTNYLNQSFGASKISEEL